MAKSSSTDGVLAGLRVLDLTGPDGLLAGQILADLGADVVQAVAASRQSDSVGDYHWRAYTRGKRLLEIDLNDASALNSLLAGADVLIESLSNAEAERLVAHAGAGSRAASAPRARVDNAVRSTWT